MSCHALGCECRLCKESNERIGKMLRDAGLADVDFEDERPEKGWNDIGHRRDEG